MKLLKIIYDSNDGVYEINREQFYELTPEVQKLITVCTNYLKEEGYIKPYATCVDIPISYKITSFGIRQIEEIQTTPAQVISNITINGDVQGIVGHTVTGNSIYQGYNLNDFKQLLDSSISNKQELEEIKLLLEPLFKRMEINAPLDKGVLGKVSEHLQKHDGVYSALLTLIVSYLSK